MGFLSDLIGGGGGASIIGSALGFLGNSSTNKANKNAADDANAFTTYMMSNRHQMEVADLRAAGLNPILSAGGTPSMGSAAKADVESSGEAMSRASSTALQAALLKSQIENIRSDTQLKRDQSSKALNEISAIRTNIAGMAADNVLKELDAKIYGSAAGKILRGGEKVGGAVGSVGAGLSSATGAFRGLNISKSNPGFQLPTKTVTRHYAN